MNERRVGELKREIAERKSELDRLVSAENQKDIPVLYSAEPSIEVSFYGPESKLDALRMALGDDFRFSGGGGGGSPGGMWNMT